MYAVIIMRAQPFHIGHQYLIDQAKVDGLIPMILLGSSNVFDKRNPYSTRSRIEMIRLANPDILVSPLPDFSNYDDWIKAVKFAVTQMLELPLDKTTFYVNHKEEDKNIFILNGKEYTDYYSKALKLQGWKVKAVKPLLDISASEIRKDIEANKQCLHKEVYSYIKGK